MDSTSQIAIASLTVAVLSVLVSVILHFRSEAKSNPKLSGSYKLEEWPLLTPVERIAEQGAAKTYRLVITIRNISVPPRTLFLKRAKLRIWPEYLPLLVKEYPIDDPLLGDAPDDAHQNISPDSEEEFRVSPDPYVHYFRKTWWPGSFKSQVILTDETGNQHNFQIPISKRLAERFAQCTTRNEYLAMFNK